MDPNELKYYQPDADSIKQRNDEVRAIIAEQEEQERLLQQQKLAEQEAEQKRIAEETRLIQDAAVKNNMSPDSFEVVNGKVYYKKPSERAEGEQDVSPITNPQDTLSRGSLPGKGLIQGISDAFGMVPWLKPVDNLVDRLMPEEEDPGAQLVRDASALILPVMLGNAGVAAVSSKVNSTVMLSSKTKAAGELAARLGVESAVAFSSSQSAEDPNLAQQVNDLLGTNIPGATTDDDLPAVRRKKHVLEAAGFFAFGELLGIGLKAGRRLFMRGTDEASQEIVDKIPRLDPEDPVDSAHAISKAERQQVLEAETLERINKQPEIVSLFNKIPDPGPNIAYDPFIHKYAEPHETFVPTSGANALETKLDIAERVYNPNYPSGGRSPNVATESFEKKFMGITKAGDRKDALDELFNTIAPSIDAIKDGSPKYSAEDINLAVDVLVEDVFNPEMSVANFTQTIENFKNNLYESQAILGEQEFEISAKAFKKAFLEMYNPNSMRASALLVDDAAGQAADIAHAVTLIPSKDTSNLQIKVLEKLEVVAQEVRANQYVSGRQLALKKLANDKKIFKNLPGGKSIQRFLIKEAEDFETGFAAAKQQGMQTVRTFQEIAQKNPEYLKPFIEAVDATNGRVDTLHKLKAYADKNIGFWKAMFNNDPDANSWLIRGLTGVRYNAMLAGKSAINAMEGNLIGLALKPLSVGFGQFATGKGLGKTVATYGGVYENFTRALRHMSEEYKFVSNNPEVAMARGGRADLIQKGLDSMEVMDSMAEVWKKEGQHGKVMLWNLSKGMHGFNNSKFARYGINAMYALDGFTNSMIMSANSRAKAYQELISNPNSYTDFKKAFKEKSDEVYNQYFDANGALKQQLPDSVKYQSSEIAFNLDDELANQITALTDRTPILKALFSFPRTGINALKYSWSYNPVGGVIANQTGVGKMGAVFNAKSKEEITEALALHGISDFDMEAFTALKSEYIGRQLFGSTVVTAAGLWAFNGNLRGNGPTSGRDRKAMQAVGWRPRTIKNPFTGQWVSYENREPFTSILATVADIAYTAQRVDQSTGEQFFQKAVAAIAVGPTSNTFLSGLRPLAAMLSGDKGEWNRFLANTATSQIPYSGAVSSLNRVITPQLKDVQDDIAEYTKNRYKFLMSGQEHLQDLLDIYTGKPINHTDPLNAMLNEFVPFYQTNVGEEPWRQQLISSGWKGMPSHQMNPYTGSELKSEERYFINNWVATHVPLVEQIEELFDESTERGRIAMQSLREYRQTLGLTETQRQNPIRDIFMHDELDKMHREAFKMAFVALRSKYDEFEAIGNLRSSAKKYKEDGLILEAKERLDKAQELETQYLEDMRRDFQEQF
tara:strand:+ start:8101 stop:12141 length:4041 start_codon:yes stop_codon:yes gene_type:complete